MKNKGFYRFMMFVALILTVSVIAACGNGSDEESSEAEATEGESEGMVVEVVAKGFQHDFWRAVKQGAQEAADENGVEMKFVGPKDESAIAEQVEMLNNAVNKNPDAIALAALDTSALLGPINQAMEKDIPIIGFDSGVPDAPEGAIDANASTDNYAAGELAAESMYPAIEEQVSGAEGDVRIGVVAQEVNSLSITQRTQGFIEKMVELSEAELGEGTVAVTGHQKLSNSVSEGDAKLIIETRVPAQLTDSAGQTEAQTLLNKEDLIAIYGSNEFAAKAIINADSAISGGRIGPDKVVAVGFDSGALQLDAIQSEKFYGSVTQDPVSIGYNTVDLAIKATRGEEVSDVDTGAKWYNSENIESDEIQALVYE
ncbi:ABC transporter substrate-binding protein [Salinicoccus hispanicus]|uniref:Substrate-binding domain-containing protein n=1 Tax=Salinicoccus hispanicus TaxID=157225 RepID=A0A6N8U235_9STAP|nr:ABC transporter substrate-binding protein [Salinicoccus hispanicus]MXQ51016.1 substrate-binding domain-containing protein [Salinicoccus hispanicus]